jgi:hypothetical protein
MEKGASVLQRFLVVLAAAIPILLGPQAPSHADEEKRFKAWGDLRGRYEGFWFETDVIGPGTEHRSRLRYRLRLNGNFRLHPSAAAEVQLGTGDTDSRSGNQSLGAPVDFGPHEIDIRRAYLIWTPYREAMQRRDGSWAFHFGRVPNPFVWNHGKDAMIWDSDINQGGLSTQFKSKAGDRAAVFANAGYYVLDENGKAKDAYLAAGQVGLERQLGGKSSAGARATYYYFDRLDADFIARGVDGTGGVTSGGGNIADGLTGDPAGGSLRTFEAQAFAGGPGPVSVYGGWSRNLSAEASQLLAVSPESDAWNAGVELGSSKSGFGQVGLMYVWIEANAFPSQFIDSDFLDGYTNRKGGVLFYGRQVASGIDCNATVMVSDAIVKTQDLSTSVRDSQRTRVQLDVTYKF